VAAIPGHRDDKKLSPKAREEGKAKEKEKDREKAKLDVLVRFRGNVGAVENGVVAGLGGKVQRKHRSGWASVRLPGKKVRDLADHPLVEYVATDSPIGAAAMVVQREVAGQPALDLPESGLTGAGVTIAMLDTGVSSAHAEFQTLVAAVDFVGTYDPTFAVANAVDPNGHGTHVAGIMVSNGTRSSERRLAGIAPGANLVSVRVLDDMGRGHTSAMLAGLNWVLEHKDQYGIRVINLSLGHPVYEPAANDPLVQAVETLWDAGIVVVCSAGNSGKYGHGTISSPCNSPKVITVGAVNHRTTLEVGDDIVSLYSSRGPTRVDLVAKPDLLAPGNKIVSALSPGSYLDVAYPTFRVAGDPAEPEVREHFKLTGTSMAAPLVAGTAALMLEQQPALNPATVKARLMLSARKVSFGDPFAAGAGVLDILGALRAAGEVANAPSPRVFADAAEGTLNVENTGLLWGNASFSLQALWSSSVLWTDGTQWDQPVVSTYGLLTADTGADALLWPTATLWPEAALWPESTLWAESVIWDEDDFEDIVESLNILIDDDP
jgi:serine protease AprX